MTTPKASKAGRPLVVSAPAPEVVMNEAALRADQAALDAAEMADQTAADLADLYVLAGHMQAAHFIETVSSKMIANAYLKAKALLGKVGTIRVRGPDGKVRTVSSLADFCDLVMPFSQRRCQQIIDGIRTIGEDLYEQSERLGFGARDYRALKALPNDDQELVKQAIAAGDASQVFDLLGELAARNAKLRADNTEAAETMAAKDRLIQQKNADLDAEKLKRRFKPSKDSAARTEAERLQFDHLTQVTNSVWAALQTMSSFLDQASEAMTPTLHRRSEEASKFLVDELVKVIERNNLQVSIPGELYAQETRPAWLDEHLALDAAAAPKA